MKLKFPLLALSFLSLAAVFMPAKSAQAACTRCCNCETIRNYIVDEVNKHETFLRDRFWKQNLEPAMARMSNQISEALISQTTSIGGFVNAQNNIERVRMLQELNADTASSYLPSEQLCRFGSLSQSLAASEAKARANRMFLAQRSQNRQLGAPNMASSTGDTADMDARMRNFMSRYCDPTDNNGQMKSLCVTRGNDKSLNADIDYVRTLEAKPTLNVDFTTDKTNLTDDEQNIIALGNNLFAHQIFTLPAASQLEGGKTMNDARTAFMDMRALVAKRSVAENSFNTLVGQKSQGAPGAREFIAGVLKELGLEDKATLAYLGGTPSYDAQMEVLTKKLYQNPSFYVNLMDNPANVQRQYAAMQSFGLMQQRDIFDSILRSELLLSLIVEMEVAKYQNEAQSRMDVQ